MAFLLVLTVIGTALVGSLIWLLQPFVVVRHGEAVLLERWGKPHSVLQEGFHWLVPLMHRLRAVRWIWGEGDARTVFEDYRIPLQQCSHEVLLNCVVGDRLVADLQLAVQYKIKDVRMAVCTHQNLWAAMDAVLVTETQQLAQSMSLAQLHEKLPEALRGRLQNSEQWLALGLSFRSATLRRVWDETENEEVVETHTHSLQQRLDEARQWALQRLEIHQKELEMLRSSGHSDAVICSYLQRYSNPVIATATSTTQ